jgi:HlyD family secretion protein
MQAVAIGHTNGIDAEVLGGITAGAEVVVHPSDRVADGARIVARR